MSSYINQGGLWENQRKFTAKDPDFIGSINIDGVEVQLVGWVSGSTHPKSPTINLKVNNPASFMKTAPPAGAISSPNVGARPKEDKDDDIPF